MPDAAEVYLAYVDAESRRDEDAMAAALAPDVVIELNGRAALSSAEEDAAAMAALFEAYPDYRREIIEVIGEGSRAAVRWRMFGSPRADLAGRLPALEVRGCTFVRVKDGRMIEAYVWSPAGALDEVLALLDARSP